MRIRVDELRKIIREELASSGALVEAAEEVRGGWPAAIPSYEALLDLPEKTRSAIWTTQRTADIWEGATYPIAVVLPRPKKDGGPLTVEWTSWGQFSDVKNLALNIGGAERNRDIARRELDRRALGPQRYLYAIGAKK